MLLTIFLICVSAILILGWDDFRRKRRINFLQKQLNQQQAELNILQESNKKIQDQLDSTKEKLRATFQDPVTHLISWHVFADRLQQHIKESERQSLILGLLFIDINDFKMINDAYSNEVGDAVLRETGKRLQACIRQIDSVSRFSRDTFVILLTKLTKPETAVVIAQRILQSIAEKYQIDNHEIHISCCIGMTFYPSDGKEAATLLRNADHALHIAKQHGKQGYHFFEERMQAKSQRELILSTGLNRESVINEFNIYYQPIINVNHETIFCMDASLRWQHKQYGQIEEQDIYAYAEKQRKLNFITEWILSRAARQFIAWQNLGFNPEYLALSLFPKQLESSQFIYRLSQILQESGFQAERLLLILDANFMQISFDILEKAFNMLKYLGVKIGINHFCAGPFPLRYLQHLNVNFLRIDPTIIDDVVLNKQSQALIKSIIQMGENMSIRIVAQGVQTKDQANILKELGCELMQGQFLSEPIVEGEVVNKMSVMF
ncbi:MAG: diguanylate cyclase/phosphodiesterase with PAS/PAC sensor(s) [uncultured bacterium]|nr:MAG: diguanylate cyclase/phosphodiesterase with PAS/PAC sensor(s) [uncultured bacterium]